jgi:hypothetical protein
MGKTRKDAPLKVKMARGDADCLTGVGVTNRERTVSMGRGVSRLEKRYAAKRDRRSDQPRTSLRGYGYGASNYRYAYSD